MAQRFFHIAVLGAIAATVGLLASPIGTLKAQSLSLDPQRPVIDVPRETRRPKQAPRRPAKPRRTAPHRIETPPTRQATREAPRRAAQPRASALVPTASQMGDTGGAGSIDSILRRELAPPGDAQPRRRRTPPQLGPTDSGRPLEVQRIPPLAGDVWRGVTLETFESLVRQAARRPRSRAVRMLWLRLLASDAPPPRGAASAAAFEATRLVALYRLGAFGEIVGRHDAARPERRNEVLKLFTAQARIALGDGAQACSEASSLIRDRGEVPAWRQRAFVEISVYCALRADDRRRAKLMVELARDRRVDAPLTFSIVDDLSLGRTPAVPRSTRLTLVPGKLLVLAGRRPDAKFLDAATPALLLGLANDPDIDVGPRLAAIEAAARRGIASGAQLRSVYLDVAQRRRGAGGSAAARAQRLANITRSVKTGDGGRALADARQLLREAQRAGIRPVVAAALGPDILRLREGRSTARDAETAIEILLASGALDRAVGWAIFAASARTAGPGVPATQHWELPIDVARGMAGSPFGSARVVGGLRAAERAAIAGAFSASDLHRLVTVLDALGYQVSIEMWEAANRRAQPTDGPLPPTGVLSRLGAAADARQPGLTALLAIAALGPGGASEANLITLGDALRALRRVGLGEIAHALAFEQVYRIWPRRGGR